MIQMVPRELWEISCGYSFAGKAGRVLDIGWNEFIDRELFYEVGAFHFLYSRGGIRDVKWTTNNRAEAEEMVQKAKEVLLRYNLIVSENSRNYVVMVRVCPICGYNVDEQTGKMPAYRQDMLLKSGRKKCDYCWE